MQDDQSGDRLVQDSLSILSAVGLLLSIVLIMLNCAQSFVIGSVLCNSAQFRSFLLISTQLCPFRPHSAQVLLISAPISRIFSLTSVAMNDRKAGRN